MRSSADLLLLEGDHPQAQCLAEACLARRHGAYSADRLGTLEVDAPDRKVEDLHLAAVQSGREVLESIH